jgi:hypothetical protein
MADPRRFEIFADYVARYYPDKSLRIADVAGNLGHLNTALRNNGFLSVVTIDPSWRSTLGLEGVAQAFAPDMARSYELIVALDPHNVTSVVMEAARYVPTIFVPCCVKWKGKWEKLEGGLYFWAIERPLINSGVRFESDTLGLTEHNRVYRTWPHMATPLDEDPNADAWY